MYSIGLHKKLSHGIDPTDCSFFFFLPYLLIFALLKFFSVLNLLSYLLLFASFLFGDWDLPQTSTNSSKVVFVLGRVAP